GALADREQCDEEGAEGIVEDEEAVEEVVVGDDGERMELQRELEELVEDAGDPASPGVYITSVEWAPPPWSSPGASP
ncbi:unnamed protein product, partial [Urochloa humidicola]